MPMTIFETVKTTVAPRMAAEHFGLSVSRNGMVCCPFHDDRHPSMKLYALFHEIIDSLDEEWQVVFKNAYLVLKEVVDLNIATIETR